MFISSTWDVKEPTHYSKRVGHEVPGVVAVLCEGMVGVGEVKYGLIAAAWSAFTYLHADVRPHTTKSKIIM